MEKTDHLPGQAEKETAAPVGAGEEKAAPLTAEEKAYYRKREIIGGIFGAALVAVIELPMLPVCPGTGRLIWMGAGLLPGAAVGWWFAHVLTDFARNERHGAPPPPLREQLGYWAELIIAVTGAALIIFSLELPWFSGKPAPALMSLLLAAPCLLGLFLGFFFTTMRRGDETADKVLSWAMWAGGGSAVLTAAAAAAVRYLHPGPEVSVWLYLPIDLVGTAASALIAVFWALSIAVPASNSKFIQIMKPVMVLATVAAGGVGAYFGWTWFHGSAPVLTLLSPAMVFGGGPLVGLLVFWGLLHAGAWLGEKL